MEVKINLSNKLFYVFVLVGVFVLLGVGVYAYGGTSPDVMGHSAGELEIPGIPACGDGQVLRHNGTDWGCGIVSSLDDCVAQNTNICAVGEILKSPVEYNPWSAWSRYCNKCSGLYSPHICPIGTEFKQYMATNGRDCDVRTRTRLAQAQCCKVSIEAA